MVVGICQFFTACLELLFVGRHGRKDYRYRCASNESTTILPSKFPEPLNAILPERQMQVAKLLADGENIKSIAFLLRISPKTVEYHRSRIYRAIDVQTFADLVKWAIVNGLTPPEPRVISSFV